MARAQALERLQTLFASQTVATLPQIQHALGAVSPMTTFRVLREVNYRRSYNHNGRYYAAYDPARFDRLGLWRFRDILFSSDGSLKATVLRMVGTAPAGLTHRELSERLAVRVHNALLDLVRSGALAREGVDGAFVYVHPDPERGAEQLAQRGREVTAGSRAPSPGPLAVSDAAVIAVLLALLRSPRASAAAVVLRLRDHAPPITRDEVHAVFARYDLEALGEKRGPSGS